MDPFENPPKVADSGLSHEVDSLKKFAKISFAFHLLMIPLIILFGDILITVADTIGSWLDMRSINLGKNDFWMVPVIGTFFTMAICSFRVWKNPEKIEWLQPLLLIHGITGVSFLIYFFVDERSMAYLLAMLMETIIFAVTFYFWWSHKDTEDRET